MCYCWYRRFDSMTFPREKKRGSRFAKDLRRHDNSCIQRCGEFDYNIILLVPPRFLWYLFLAWFAAKIRSHYISLSSDDRLTGGFIAMEKCPSRFLRKRSSVCVYSCLLWSFQSKTLLRCCDMYLHQSYSWHHRAIMRFIFSSLLCNAKAKKVTQYLSNIR